MLLVVFIAPCPLPVSINVVSREVVYSTGQYCKCKYSASASPVWIKDCLPFLHRHQPQLYVRR
jgi:hypothetical protein